MADFPYGADAPQPAFSASTLMNLTGAALSLALIAGIGIWSYKLVMRDVTGIPVVRAIEGPMRTAPEDPGGEVAANRGLAVNTIAAEGAAGAPEDRLMLAPASVQPSDEDLEVTLASAELTDEGTDDAAGINAADAISDMVADAAAETRGDSDELTEADVLALADQIAAGIQPLTELPEGYDTPVSLSVDGEQVGNPNAISADVPGVSLSPRPPARPMRITGIEPTNSGIVPASASAADTGVPVANASFEQAPSVAPSEIVAGTNLVQLGAFDSEAVADEEWTRMSAQFADFMTGKAKVIQRAESGGRTFYRLRAMGFDDMSDARRFCAALVAEDALCIPVQVR
ncbi:SPOR domain-containing protein [Pelagovum pacificum]|uniref:SPOR domain-containing protein n=1 Tax=Pelagovum pacificum TaxID=2588711 RepID=A0A5C5GBZ0_9RHOB|nr:SPOR domain-containing protein [Pelagovum pacificum]QQA44562.1 SPOR domain-containing protein [Pelagovum pacificum]TNY32325.1 SPOR domain-containing protein [Pelagovum pacificum]